MPTTWLGILSFIVSLCFTVLTIYFILPLLVKSKLTGRDLHKEEQPEIAEMGGLGLVVGISTGIVLILSLNAFLQIPLKNVSVLGVFATLLSVALIGVFDDLFEIKQILKAISPVIAAAPLIAINAGTQAMKIPLIGKVEVGLLYPLLFVPLGVTGAANAVNMLAGFNGMEAGTGFVAVISLIFVAWFNNSMTAFLILLIAAGALIGILYYNWYPAKVLIGDVGTLTIGAVIASSVIVGNFEVAGLILVAPHFIDFLFKFAHGFPSEDWCGEVTAEDNKLHNKGKVVSLPQFIMKITGGISERNLTLVIMGLEAVAGTFAVGFYTFW